MTANYMIKSLQNLLSLQEELYDKSRIKTEVIKKGDLEELKRLTNEERNFIKSINTEHKELMNHVKSFLQQHHSISMDQPTLRDCLAYVKGQEHQKLITLQSQLVEKVSLLKKQNDLNQQLLKRSLSFVQMSLELLIPEIDTYNYERPDGNQPYEQIGRSLFDSNA